MNKAKAEEKQRVNNEVKVILKPISENLTSKDILKRCFVWLRLLKKQYEKQKIAESWTLCTRERNLIRCGH